MNKEDITYCVYMHKNKINGKVYIGRSGNVAQRWHTKKHAYKQCTALYNAFNKYGWNNFDHLILFDNLTYDQSIELEQAMIKQYKSNENKFGYNLTEGGEGCIGRIWAQEEREKCGLARRGKTNSLEHRQKVSRALTGRKLSPEHREKSKQALAKGAIIAAQILQIPVCQFDINGKFVREFDSLRQAADYLGVSKSTGIQNCCAGVGKIYKGYFWCYSKDKDNFQPPKLNKKHKVFIQYRPTGAIYYGLRQAARLTNIPWYLINNSLKRCREGRPDNWVYVDPTTIDLSTVITA